MKKIIFVVFIIVNFSFAADINDAIKVFNNKEYKKSFEMFSKIKSPEAIKYYKKSCDLNYAKSCDYLKSLNKNQNDYKKIYN